MNAEIVDVAKSEVFTPVLMINQHFRDEKPICLGKAVKCITLKMEATPPSETSAAICE
jgi:hypothetical protein